MNLTLPGLVDIHVNGFAGVDYNNADLTAEDLVFSLDAMRQTGVTRCLPTLITSSLPHFAASARELVRSTDPMIAGLHMEGPYISPHDGPRGAHPRDWVIAASVEDFKRRQDAAQGRIKLVTLAPEVPGALDLIEHLVAHDIVVGLGHSAASAQCIHDAVTAGATISTHLGNGCAATMDRHHNVLWPQLANDGLVGAFIADGHHLPRDILRAMVRAKGLDRTILVTDTTAAANAPVGIYRLADLKIQVDAQRKVTQVGATNLAGSALTLDVAVAHVCRWCDLSLPAAWALASSQAARAVGIPTSGTVEVTWDAGPFALKILQTNP